MIRLPVTSISLSARDISVHLRQIDVYHGLLKQGFSKKDIRKYLRARDDAITSSGDNGFSIDASGIPNHGERTGCEEKTLSSQISHDHSLLCPAGTDIDSGSAVQVDTVQTDQTGEIPTQPQSQLRNTSPELCDRPSQLKLRHKHRAISDVHSHQHNPRQSSLLRFSSNISSDEQESIDPAQGSLFRARSQVRYRQRTEISSPDRSEEDDHDSSASSLATVFRDLLIDESLVPTTITGSQTPTPGIITEEPGKAEKIQSRIPFNQSPERSLPTLLSNSSFETDEMNMPRIVPMLQIRAAAQHSPHTRSSPSLPLSITQSTDQAGWLPSSPILPTAPTTPHLHRAPLESRTVPQNMRFRYYDGSSFTPYNDSVPADIQPQTPADLSNQPILDELNTSYTALPGRLRNDVSSTQLNADGETEHGQESPTNRAINMRRRRNREYARSARVEILRINRLRRRLEPEGNHDQARLTRPNNMWEFQEHLNLWRDDLDADRVGDENFEDVDRLPDTNGTGMRVVSGNRHANGL